MAFTDEMCWYLHGVTSERIPREVVRDFCASIISQTSGMLQDEEPHGFEDAWNNTVAMIVGPDAEGAIAVMWHDCGTKPAMSPNELDDIVFLCDGKPETDITFHMYSIRPDGIELDDPSARESLEKTERAMVNLAGMLAHHIPSLVFHDRSGAIYSAVEMARLAVEHKQRDESWGYKLAEALKRRVAQQERIQLEAFENALRNGTLNPTGVSEK
ncbi:MAG TPA: hypothetical protein VGZ00_09475 [Candidatus Baltobacteraceae bacterium]|jgi:hypothetical protein|nr:hypothetical protein [Candidatus Baltobacteraceae bacterium]